VFLVYFMSTQIPRIEKSKKIHYTIYIGIKLLVWYFNILFFIYSTSFLIQRNKKTQLLNFYVNSEWILYNEIRTVALNNNVHNEKLRSHILSARKPI